MRKMIDSGVEWLGAIPQDWDLVQIKSIASCKSEKSSYIGGAYIGLEHIESGSGKLLADGSQTGIEVDSTVSSFSDTDILFGKLRPYLATVARNCAKNRLRGYRETVGLEQAESICCCEDIEQEIDQKILAEMLQDVLDALAPKDREILVRHYYYYEGVKQIAEDLGMKESAVKMRMSRARKRLQQELIDRGYAYEDSPAVQKIQFAAI